MNLITMGYLRFHPRRYFSIEIDLNESEPFMELIIRALTTYISIGIRLELLIKCL